MKDLFLIIRFLASGIQILKVLVARHRKSVFLQISKKTTMGEPWRIGVLVVGGGGGGEGANLEKVYQTISKI